MILFWSLYVFTPDRKDALLIVAGGGTMEFLTTDSTAKQIPHELSSFVVTQLKNMGKEAQVELGIQSQKDRILDEAKNMTSQQLLEKMKIDTNFANIILNK
jgi:D-arabinose 5-phosphate isomerase GutQ